MVQTSPAVIVARPRRGRHWPGPRQALQQLLQPQDEITEFFFHIIVLLVGSRERD